MKDINKVILIGRLGADPIQRQTKNGTRVVHFSVATSRKFFRENNSSDVEPTQAVEETQWHNIVSWGKQGEACAQYLKKGSSVYVEGHLKSSKYEDRTGVQRTSFEIVSDTISFLSSPRSFARKDEEVLAVAG